MNAKREWAGRRCECGSEICAIIAERDRRIEELEIALRALADGEIDEGGNRRNHPDAMRIARRALAREPL